MFDFDQILLAPFNFRGLELDLFKYQIGSRSGYGSFNMAHIQPMHPYWACRSSFFLALDQVFSG